MSESRPDIIRRKAQLTDEKPTIKKVVDFIKPSAIITADSTLDKCSGSLLIKFHNGGITSTELSIII